MAKIRSNLESYIYIPSFIRLLNSKSKIKIWILLIIQVVSSCYYECQIATLQQCLQLEIPGCFSHMFPNMKYLKMWTPQLPQRRWDEASAKNLVAVSSLLVDFVYSCTLLWKPHFLKSYGLDGFLPGWDIQSWLQDAWIPSWKPNNGSIQTASLPFPLFFYLFRVLSF